MKSKMQLTEEEKEDLAFAVSVATTGGGRPQANLLRNCWLDTFAAKSIMKKPKRK